MGYFSNRMIADQEDFGRELADLACRPDAELRDELTPRQFRAVRALRPGRRAVHGAGGGAMMDTDPRTKTLVTCAQCGNGHWLPDPRLLQEHGEWFCNEDCREQRREFLKVKHAAPGAFVAAVAAYHRYQEGRHARIMREIEERRARNAAELARLDAEWEARR